MSETTLSSLWSRLRCGCRSSSSAWVLPWTPLLLLMLDPGPDLVSASLRAGCLALTALVVWWGGREAEGRACREGSLCSLVTVRRATILWAVAAVALLAIYSRPPALWLDAATAFFAVALYYRLETRR